MGKIAEYVIGASAPLLEPKGWMFMVNNNDGYLYTRMNQNHVDGTPVGQQVGDLRMKYEYVECTDVSIVSQ